MSSRPTRILAALIVAAMPLLIGACSKKSNDATMQSQSNTAQEVKVTSVDLGKSIGDDKRIKDAATTFGRHDTIYAAISTEGVSPKATLKARWTFGAKGTLVNEEARDIAPTGPAVTEFHIAKPSGWPPGKYKLEVSADGTTVSTKEFDVTK